MLSRSPSRPSLLTHYVLILIWSWDSTSISTGRFDEAEPELQRAQDLNPQLASVHLTRGQILLRRGRPQDALLEMHQEPGDWQRLLGEALAYLALGRSSDSDRALQQLIATHQNDCAFQIAEIYAARGETDEAFQWMNRAVRQSDPSAPQFPTDPLMKRLPHDERYAKLLKQTHHGQGMS
jgi:adenylate cyclase